MKVLIVSATEFEVAPLRDIIAKNALPHEVDFLISGVGMVATAFALGKHLNEKQYELAINVGVGGALSKEMPLGTVVEIVQDQMIELGAENGKSFIDVFEMGLVKPNLAPYSEGVLKANTPSIIAKKLNLPKVNGITVNKVHGNAKSIEIVKQKHPKAVESMEGAAFFYACVSSQILCVQLRGISNHVEVRNKDNWQLDLAIEKVNQAVFELLKNIKA